jgi:hypothetical protein
VTPFAEREALIGHAAALARRSAWHVTQAADLADEAEKLPLPRSMTGQGR